MRFFDARRWKLYDKQTASSETSLPIRKQIYHLYSVRVTHDAATKYTIVPNSMHATYAFQTPKDYYFRCTTRLIRSAQAWDKTQVGS